MTKVFHEILPESYLIILAPGPVGNSEAMLDFRLRRAVQSGKKEVWVDCSLLTTLSEQAARLLWAAHHTLQEQFAHLVLVHMSDKGKQQLRALELGPLPRIVPTLLDASCAVAYHY